MLYVFKQSCVNVGNIELFQAYSAGMVKLKSSILYLTSAYLDKSVSKYRK